MGNSYWWVMMPVAAIIGWLQVIYYASKRLYNSDELFARTPTHDRENVKEKHKVVWVRMVTTFVISLLAVTFVAAILRNNYFGKINVAFDGFGSIASLIILIPAVVFMCDARYSSHGSGFLLWDRKPYIVTRYMAYPERKISVSIATMISCSVFGGLAAFVCGMSGQGVGISEAAANSPLAVICLAVEIFCNISCKL